jgi:putative PIN family toxin of toxin-antitoxin system
MKSEPADKPFIVFDTNVLISGYLWNGKSRQALQIIKSDKFKLLYCRESIDELVRVLSIKFHLNAQEIYRIVLDISSIGEVITVTSKEDPVRNDPSDNLFINLARDGKAQVIVSGDSHLLKLKTYKRISIITVSEFVNRTF